jgi:site-specific DNA-methyltransferase (adenine-specific)
MSATLTLPDPQAMAVARVRSELLPVVAALREQYRARGAAALPDARELNRRLAAFQRYVHDRGARDLLAAEQRRTEVLIGHLLGPPHPGERTDLLPTGKGFDVPTQDQHKFRRLAAHEPQVEAWLTAEHPVVSRTALLAKLDRREENAALDGAAVPEVRTGDFRSALATLPDGCATLVLTDPPYTTGALPSYDALGVFARRVLRPGGSLVCYAGGWMLPDTLNTLGRHLTYWETLALVYRHGAGWMRSTRVMVGWKPVLWFVKDFRLGQEYVSNVLHGSAPEKAHHAWAQGIAEVVPLIERLTEPGELVVDPFAGSGAFGRAALGLGRRFVGADLDPESAVGTVAPLEEAAG